jgi:NCS1 family nucleobase:cation symporter-1
VTCYFLGILIQLPFVASALYTGPVARALGGIDLSWVVGLLVTSPTYYWLAKWARSRQDAADTPARVGATSKDDIPPDHKVFYI